MTRSTFCLIFLNLCLATPCGAIAGEIPKEFFQKHCHSCHDGQSKKGGLDLAGLKLNEESFLRWVKVFERVGNGEMPPKNRKPPESGEKNHALNQLQGVLLEFEKVRKGVEGKTGLRRLTRGEYENTMRDLFHLEGIPLQGELPGDGSAHGFDNNSDALDISHVNLAKYLEAADRVLDMAIATRPRPPAVVKQRISLANPAGFVAHVLMHGDGVILKDKKPDPEFPPAGAHMHIDQGAHERMGSFMNGSSVGLFRHEDESFHPYFIEFVTIYPGKYRVKTPLWSFQWDKGQVLPARGTEAARLSIVTLTGDGRGGGHPSTVLGYFDAPSLKEKLHEFEQWLNPREIIGFNAASLAPGAQTRGKNRAMGFTGPGIACDFFEIEGPYHEVWPPRSHKEIFGDLPIVEFKKEENPGIFPPKRKITRQEMGAGKNRPDLEPGIWTVHSKNPMEDANRLLASFLPKAFRRPVTQEIRKQYLAKVEERLKAGDCFETAMRWAYRAALCSADFLYHVEPAGKLDQYALACRLSYFLWKSMPDEQLFSLAGAKKLNGPLMAQETERLLHDGKSARFIEDFLGQWLKLRSIAATDPDRKLYPEFSPYLQDSMVLETRAYFKELLEKNLGASFLIKSDFAMVNEKLATHYGIPGVSGSQIRRVQLPAGSARGPFLTQAALHKVTANGTTTSPVTRGAFVIDRLLGQPPDPPPPDVPAIEPDVRGAKTIREQLDKHRTNSACASCHVKIDPPGFALEAFDVIGGYRERYRSIGTGDPAPRGNIDPFIGIGFKLGPKVDPSGEWSGIPFRTINEFQEKVAGSPLLLRNLARQFSTYATSREITFSDRGAIDGIVQQTEKKGGGIRTLVHELIQSDYFRTR